MKRQARDVVGSAAVLLYEQSVLHRVTIFKMETSTMSNIHNVSGKMERDWSPESERSSVEQKRMLTQPLISTDPQGFP